MKKVELQSIAGGALQEKFERSFNRILSNMIDKNTHYKAKREMDIKLKFIQNEARDDFAVDIEVKEKLAPQEAITTKFAVDTDLHTGEIVTEEYGNRQIKGQMSMEDKKEDGVIDIRNKEAK